MKRKIFFIYFAIFSVVLVTTLWFIFFRSLTEANLAGNYSCDHELLPGYQSFTLTESENKNAYHIIWHHSEQEDKKMTYEARKYDTDPYYFVIKNKKIYLKISNYALNLNAIDPQPMTCKKQLF